MLGNVPQQHSPDADPDFTDKYSNALWVAAPAQCQGAPLPRFLNSLPVNIYDFFSQKSRFTYAFHFSRIVVSLHSSLLICKSEVSFNTIMQILNRFVSVHKILG